MLRQRRRAASCRRLAEPTWAGPCPAVAPPHAPCPRVYSFPILPSSDPSGERSCLLPHPLLFISIPIQHWHLIQSLECVPFACCPRFHYSTDPSSSPWHATCPPGLLPFPPNRMHLPNLLSFCQAPCSSLAPLPCQPLMPAPPGSHCASPVKGRSMLTEVTEHCRRCNARQRLCKGRRGLQGGRTWRQRQPKIQGTHDRVGIGTPK